MKHEPLLLPDHFAASSTRSRPVLVTLHAHPDDEAIFTGGTIVRAVRAGWRVVLVVATDGDRGRGSDEAGLASTRRQETLAAAELLGVERVEFLGYGDSGYHDPSDADQRDGVASARALRAGTLADSYLEAVAARVRRILVEEDAVALTSYDDNGIYGHIDHVLVHELAVRAIEGTTCEHYESTLARSALRRLRHELIGRGLVGDVWPTLLAEQLGVDDEAALVAVDVSEELEYKRTAVAAHSSQLLEASAFMGLPPGAFHHLFGTEWFRVARRGRGRFLDMLRAADHAALEAVAV
jgi:LmbE family N-acetylglucosaminyl deacetylase